MNEEQPPSQNQQTEPASTQPIEPTQPVQQSRPVFSREAEQSTIKVVERITVWIMVLSAIFFAIISLLAIWGTFGENAGDVVWRSLTSLGVIAFTALIVNVGARMIEGKKK